MGKPQLNLEKKDDIKKPDGSLVKVITIQDEPAPLRKEPVYVTTSTRTGRSLVKIFCTLLCALLLIVLSFMLVTYVLSPYRGYRCGVGYYDDYDVLGSDSDYWSSEGVLPYGNDGLFAPRPTGAPLQRYLEEGVEINLDLQFIRINTPTDNVQGVSVIHDFDLSLSAYLVPSSEVCYIRPLNFDSTLSPEDFQSLLETEAYTNQEFPMSHETYTVDPNEVVTDVGDHIEEMCADYTSYYIYSIPSDQNQAFWRTAFQVVRDHVRGSFSDEDGEGRRGGRPHARRHGSSDSSSDSSSEDVDRDAIEETEGVMAPRLRHTFAMNYFDNLRSFDGQQVVNIAVFQTHTLDGLSEENLERLMAFKDETVMP